MRDRRLELLSSDFIAFDRDLIVRHTDAAAEEVLELCRGVIAASDALSPGRTPRLFYVRKVRRSDV